MSDARPSLPHVRLGRAAAAMLAATASLALTALAGAPAAAAQCPNEGLREDQNAGYLPDCRAYELVSPALKNGSEVLPHVSYQSEIPFQAAVDGNSVFYAATGGLLDTESSGHASFYFADSAQLGSPWADTPLNPESRFTVRTGGQGGTVASTGEFRFLSPGLNCGVMETSLPQAASAEDAAPLLAPGETAEEAISNLYAWDTVDGIRRLVTSVKPDNPSEDSGLDYKVLGASEDCERVVFQSEYQFLGAPRILRAEGREERVSTIYEWNAAADPQLRIASILPDGQAAATVSFTEAMLGEVADDAHRTFFEAPLDAGSQAAVAAEVGKLQVFARVDGSSTVEVSRSTTETPDRGALYELASADGSRVLFLANNGLAATSSGAGSEGECRPFGGVKSGCELYQADVDAHTLVDLSADSNAADAKGAGVQGVLGASADGSYVYFSATGQLVPDAGNSQPQNEATSGESALGLPKTGAEANVYEAHAGQLAYITTIGAEEAGGVAGVSALSDSVRGAPPIGLKYLAARVERSGLHALLATRLPVRQTGGAIYDNHDRVSGKPDFESYEFDAPSGQLLCTSCMPNGERPIQSGPVSSNFDYEVNWFAVQQNLLGDGRVLFTSIAPLVPQATNGALNVYEWTPGGVGGCEQSPGCVQILDSGTDPSATFFEGVSADGDSVYVTTYSRLAPYEDEDGLRDMYDVRAGGGFPPPAPGTRCSGESCQAPGPGLEERPRGSEQESSGGNVAPGGGPGGHGTGGVGGFTARDLKGSKGALSVTAPGAGTITIAGRGLRPVTRHVTRAGVYRVVLALTARERRLLHRRHKLRLSVRVTFTPTSGAGTSVSSRVTFSQKP